MNILVTGGAGYIGSHTVRALIQAGLHLLSLIIFRVVIVVLFLKGLRS